MAYKLISGNPYYNDTVKKMDLKGAAIRFINRSCEDLRFSADITEREKANGVYEGVSLKKGQIPYNQQMEVDRLCLEYALSKFLDTGNIQDAYNVYYCYIEMFIGTYHTSRKMIEFLSEFERNGSRLLMKHRDHYSHSVYVFALGLAIYETNPSYRESYSKFYKTSIDAVSRRYDIDDREKCAAHHFLEHWGLTSLFHDIGYPFEIPFEQVENYFDQTPGETRNSDRRKASPYMSYNRMDRYTSFDESTTELLKESFGKNFLSTDELFAYVIEKYLGKEYRITKNGIEGVLKTKPTNPNIYSYFMDHAYFSATTLCRELLRIGEITYGSENKAKELTRDRIDCLVAILLHNSLFKFSISAYKDKIGKPLDMELFPIAYMLMICDELQVWDRTAYGRESRTQLHPMGCDFIFHENGHIDANYIFDKKENHKIESYLEKWEQWKRDVKEGTASKKPPKLKSYDGFYMSSADWEDIRVEDTFSMLADIRRIVRIDGERIGLGITVENRTVQHRGRRRQTSDINVIDIFNLAVAIHNRSRITDVLNNITDEMIGSFESMSLEYKLGCLSRAECFDDFLENINAFMSDRPVDCELLESFTEEESVMIGRMEHLRWVHYHLDMGWKYGTDFSDKGEREQKRIHNLMVPGENITDEMINAHYDSLPEKEQDKDTRPMNVMLLLLNEFDGIRIYRD